MSENQGEPAEFLLDQRERANILVFYEDESYAKHLEMIFLKIGLVGSQAVLYLSPLPIESIERNLVSAGIDIESFRERKLLDVFSTATLSLKQYSGIIEKFAKKAEKLDCSARITIHHKSLAPEHFDDLEMLEYFLDTAYQNYNVSIFDSYDAEIISDVKLMQQMINLHDHAVFAPSFGKGVVINTR